MCSSGYSYKRVTRLGCAVRVSLWRSHGFYSTTTKLLYALLQLEKFVLVGSCIEYVISYGNYSNSKLYCRCTFFLGVGLSISVIFSVLFVVK
jgi:hypothetical protein